MNILSLLLLLLFKSSRVTKNNNSNTTMCSTFSVFLKLFSVNETEETEAMYQILSDKIP